MNDIRTICATPQAKLLHFSSLESKQVGNIVVRLTWLIRGLHNPFRQLI